MLKPTTLVTVVLTTLLAVGCGGSKSKRSLASSSTAGVTTSSGTTSSGTTGGGGGTTGGGGGTTGGGGGTTTVTPSGVFVDGSAALPTSAESDWSVAAGDVNGDGLPDVVIAVNGGQSRVLINQGSSFTVLAGALPALVTDATDVHLVDLDGDSDLDVVLAANYAPLRIYRNDGSGRFALRGEYATSNTGYTYKVAIGDANGDGFPDVYMANAGLNSSTQGIDALLLNDRTGAMLDAPQGSLPAGLRDDTLGATFADVDGDGDADIFAANFVGGHVLLINDGTGRYTDGSRALPATPDQGATAVQAADVNNDGFVDLFVVNEGLAPAGGGLPVGAPNLLLLNSGTGSFTDASALVPSVAEAGFNVVLADVNGDGLVDALCANLRGQQRIYLGSGGGLFRDFTTTNFPAVNTTASNSMGVAIADFNRDRTPDVMFVRRGQTPFLFNNRPR